MNWTTYDSGRRRILRIIGYVAVAAAVVMLPFTLNSLGPAWSAHEGHGKPGTFTSTSQTCQKNSHGTGRHCSYKGDFTATDGSGIRHGVAMGDPGVTRVGESIPAVDTGGGTVYPVGGGSAWLATTLFLALEIVVVVLGVVLFVLGRLRRRRGDVGGGYGGGQEGFSGDFGQSLR